MPMDRCAIFVDAGYLLAAGGSLCCGTKVRAGFTCDYKGLAAAIQQFAEGHSPGHSVLRTYWYDGARNAVPTPDHLTISELPNIKLRLGRISGGEQKGVDSLILRDFMTLARERAMITAYLLAGDEDLREGVVAAQDMGVRVVVLGIPGIQDNQARTLIREADNHVMLQKDFWAPYFSALTVVAPAIGTAEDTRLAGVGADLAASWARRATPEELHGLLGQYPTIPKELDLQLVLDAERSLGSLRGRGDLKKEIRIGFWQALKHIEQAKP
jgi:hypothetical protein